MAYVYVSDFKGGLDRKRKQVNGVAGTLWEATNVHITRGGDIERRKKFVSKYALPAAETFGLHGLSGVLYTFGSAAAPGVPAGVTYQRLQHPDGATAMTGVIKSESFDGKIYVIASFSDGAVLHFYDGVVIEDWIAGIVRADMTNTDGVAEHLKDLIDAHADYSASRSGSVVTVTGPVGTSYDVSTTAENVEGGTDDQTLVSNTTQAAIASVAEVLASTTFSVTGGTPNTAATGSVELTGGAGGSIDDVTVNGVSIIGSTVNFNSDLPTTASDLATEINGTTSSPNYSASADGAIVTISAAQSEGADANTFVVTSSATTITTSDTNMSGGVTNAVTSITVDGIEILGARVNWAVSNSGVATNLETQIDGFTSSPEYSASSDGSTVTITAAAATGASPNGFTVSITKVGDVTTSTPDPLAEGVDAATGQPKIVTLTVGGTFEVGDRFNAKLGDVDFGHVGNPSNVNETALTFKNKVYGVKDSLLNFSGVGSATVWNRDDTDYPGAGFINMAAQDEGSQNLTAVEPYQGNLAVFSRSAIQIWFVEADDAANTFLQTIKNTGTRAPKSVRSYGNNDVFYLADSGVRSIKARDSSNAAFVSDVGTAIDSIMVEYVNSLADARIEAAISVLEPEVDRYWLAVGGRIWVFSYFPSPKISAWTYYDTTDDINADISELVRLNNRIYARAGDTVYLYGGDDNDTYPGDDEIVATVTLQFLSAGTPGTVKNLEGFDAAVEGEWDVNILVDPNDNNAFIDVGTIAEATYPDGRAAATGSTTHFAPKLVCRKAGPATISDLVVHYEDPNEDG